MRFILIVVAILVLYAAFVHHHVDYEADRPQVGAAASVGTDSLDRRGGDSSFTEGAGPEATWPMEPNT